MERPEILLFNINVSSPFPNLGQASLSAYLKAHGIHVLQHTCSLLGVEAIKSFSSLTVKTRLLFRDIEAFLAGEKTFSQLSENQRVITKILILWAQVIHRENPVSLGISVAIRNVLFSLLLIRIVKKSLPGIKIILGGPECNVTTGEFFLRGRYADVVVVGEGEVPLYKTLCCIREQRPIEAPGVMTLVNNEVVSAPSHHYPLDINTLPAPDFGKALTSNGKLFALPIGFNRGCSFRCAFCNERTFWKTFRQMNATKAVAILEQLKETYGVNRFLLSQSLMNNDLAWLEEFAFLLRQKNTGVLWGGNARIHPDMDQKYLGHLHQGGCRFLFWGIESGSLSVLKSMKKGTTPEMNKKALQDAASNGIWNHTYWILGFPTETEHDLLETVNFILENNEIIHSCFFVKYHHPGIPVSKETHTHSLLDYYRRLSAYKISHRSSLVEEFPGFFSQIVKFCGIHRMTRKIFEGKYSPLEAPEEKKELLAVMHVLRYFIITPDNRKEVARLFKTERFHKVYQEFSKKNHPDMESFADTGSDIGVQLFRLLKNQH